MPGLNTTDPLARQVHGTDPQVGKVFAVLLPQFHLRFVQNLVEHILRNRIYDSLYWKQHCFALNGKFAIYL
jgi:pre-mRNA-splicing factor 38A